jgi:Ni/Co efflux regulator RcnB
MARQRSTIKEITMRRIRLAIGAAVTLLAFSGAIALAQDRGQRNDQRGHTQFDDHDQQVARDWYNHHRDHPPAGLRDEDRLSADEESRLREGEVLDRHLRRKVHAAPRDLTRQLPPPARHHRYVTIGGHIGLIDNTNHVRAVIHLHDNQ